MKVPCWRKRRETSIKPTLPWRQSSAFITKLLWRPALLFKIVILNPPLDYANDGALVLSDRTLMASLIERFDAEAVHLRPHLWTIPGVTCSISSFSYDRHESLKCQGKWYKKELSSSFSQSAATSWSWFSSSMLSLSLLPTVPQLNQLLLILWLFESSHAPHPCCVPIHAHIPQHLIVLLSHLYTAVWHRFLAQLHLMRRNNLSRFTKITFTPTTASRQ